MNKVSLFLWLSFISLLGGASLNSVGLNRSRFSDLQVPAPLVCIL